MRAILTNNLPDVHDATTSNSPIRVNCNHLHLGSSGALVTEILYQTLVPALTYIGSA